MPVQAVPPEIISVIFESGLEPYTDFDESLVSKREEYLASLCLVSALWKDIAYQTPQLWSVLKVDYDREQPSGRKTEPCYKVQRARLDRAKRVPLDIILFGLSHRNSTSGNLSRRKFWRFWQLVTQKNEQWRTLFIYGVHLYTMNETEDLFPPLLPNLVEVKSLLSTSFPQPPVSSAVRLSSYRTYTDFFPFTSAETLRALHINNYFHHALLILKLGVNLHTLHISNVNFMGPHPIEVIQLPALQTLFITSTYAAPIPYILDTVFDTPKLHTVSYDSIPFPDHLWEAPTIVSIPTLKTIQLSHMHILKLNNMVKLVSKFKNPRSITVHFIEIDFAIPQSDMDRRTFDRLDAIMRCIEGQVEKVIWAEREDPVKDSRFGTWPEARTHFRV